jgi:hypothetical protein
MTEYMLRELNPVKVVRPVQTLLIIEVRTKNTASSVAYERHRWKKNRNFTYIRALQTCEAWLFLTNALMLFA